MHRGCLLLAALLFGVKSLVAAEAKDLPKVTVAVPLGIAPGVKTRLTIRGLRLDRATEVRCQEPRSTTKLLKKSKVGVPNQQDVNLVGDTQVEAEVTLPPDYPNRTVTITVLTPAGESSAHALLIERAAVAPEREPNNGFRQAQAVSIPGEIQGSIAQGKDVDLYRFEGAAGQRMIMEVFAARYGSALDPLITLYDSAGQIVGACDDFAGSADARLELALPKAGTYYLGVIDANDQGGPAHVYRLSIRSR